MMHRLVFSHRIIEQECYETITYLFLSAILFLAMVIIFGEQNHILVGERRGLHSHNFKCPDEIMRIVF